ncbi:MULTISPECIES: malto-oligosyltrehalose trehalohydrolase [unclassified Aureimonas]|uniref:malto-oligosyltrehalose trehalohydrolase n=1 Tax=unclassified Aureimonas TaxID=2615206 RepID=UPI0006FAF7CE|nr:MULTISPECIES: malto-oligosyltrehalose trehalohydrolase [unclassified Aureimonas]KQT69940.1 malto-oligosyltrehalose trehalohydrolase [Aureimonas sp. Leaf427]KQT75905.1 malto-oligosyltrehalose trehalohydrolase [Aureimonas sp. Leaf460]
MLTNNQDRTFFQETSWGPRITADGAKFRLWAPTVASIELVTSGGAQADSGEGAEPVSVGSLVQGEEGWWSLETNAIAIGQPYGFRIDGGIVVPDPAARAQVGDVHSLSVLVDPEAYRWRSADWKGRPWEETVFYELHTGTFTPEGTFEAIIEKLDYLKETGITAIELLPVAQFGGQRGWGYDGVLLYAPHTVYGGVEGLKRLVDAAHERGLMVFLDVVYNHFGPDGNYIGAYAEEFFHPEIHTAWGAAIAYDKKPVREFMIENALYWLNEFRLDGLRLDAIDSIEDTTDVELVRELAARVRETITERHVHLTTEDARNITWHIERNEKDAPKLVSGEWNDDFHHCAHALATGENESYYADYSRGSTQQIARTLAEGFTYQGQHSPHRDRDVGFPSAHLPPTAFVNFIQNHDQIGNRAFGDRLADLASRRAVQCLQAILFLSPQIPLIFMGEEYGETQPFCFFTDFHGELGEAVSKGRREEFKTFAAFKKDSTRDLIPDPNKLSTFEASRLDWSGRMRPTYRLAWEENKKLLKLRQEKIVPHLKGAPPHAGSYHVSDSRAFEVCWTLADGKALHLFANLDDEPWGLPEDIARSELTDGETIYASEPEAVDMLKDGRLPGYTVVVRLADRLQIEKR